MKPLRLQIISRALIRASIFLIFNDANGRYDLEKKGDAILMSKIVQLADLADFAKIAQHENNKCIIIVLRWVGLNETGAQWAKFKDPRTT